MKEIDIIAKTSEEDWRFWGSKKEYTHHVHRNSPFDSCDSCATCDGARCDACKLITVPAHLECCITSDKLYSWLLEEGAPKDVAAEFAYSDTVGNFYRGYKLIWPNEKMLREKKSELFSLLTTPDEAIYAVINEFAHSASNFGDVERNVKEKLGTEPHVERQLEFWWTSHGESNEIFKTLNLINAFV